MNQMMGISMVEASRNHIEQKGIDDFRFLMSRQMKSLVTFIRRTTLFRRIHLPTELPYSAARPHRTL